MENIKIYLVIIEKNIVSKPFKTDFEQIFLPFFYLNCGTGQNNFVFMQDNASLNRPNHAKEKFKGVYMDIVKCPILSHLIQRGFVLRAFYSSGRQFNSVADLKNTIEEKLSLIHI